MCGRRGKNCRTYRLLVGRIQMCVETFFLASARKFWSWTFPPLFRADWLRKLASRGDIISLACSKLRGSRTLVILRDVLPFFQLSTSSDNVCLTFKWPTTKYILFTVFFSSDICNKAAANERAAFSSLFK